MFFQFSDKRSLSMLFANASHDVENKLYYLSRGYTEIIDSPVIYTKDPYFGNRITDMLSTGSIEPFVVRKWVCDLMTENGITGWKEFPVRVVDLEGNEIGEYCGLGIIGRCGGLDLSKLWTCRRADGFMLYNGVDIDKSTWDGSDLFMLPKYGHTFATAKVRTLFRKHKVSNVSFEYLDTWNFHHMEEVIKYLPENMTEDFPK